MPRSYSQFQSSRTQADFAQKAVEGLFLASNATATIPVEAVGITTGWADAGTAVNLSLVTGNDFGDSSEWAAITSNDLVLQPGTYRIQLNQTVICTSANDAEVHWAITDDAYALIHESNVAVPHLLTPTGASVTLTCVAQFSITAETTIKYHCILEEVSGTPTGVLGRGDFGQIMVYKVA